VFDSFTSPDKSDSEPSAFEVRHRKRLRNGTTLDRIPSESPPVQPPPTDKSPPPNSQTTAPLHNHASEHHFSHRQQPTFTSKPAGLSTENELLFTNAGIQLLTLRDNGHQLFFCSRCKAAICGNHLESHFKMPLPSERVAGRTYRHTSAAAPDGIIQLAKTKRDGLQGMFPNLVMTDDGNCIDPKTKATLTPRGHHSTPTSPSFPMQCDKLETIEDGFECTTCGWCAGTLNSWNNHRKTHKGDSVPKPNRKVTLQQLGPGGVQSSWFRVIPKSSEALSESEDKAAALLVKTLKELGLDSVENASDINEQDHSIKYTAPIFVRFRWTDFIRGIGSPRTIVRLQQFMNHNFLNLEEHVWTYIYKSLKYLFNPTNLALAYEIRKDTE
jgi:hypothetical protein